MEEQITKVRKEQKFQEERPSTPPLPRMMGVSQLCKVTGVSVSRIRKLVKEGKIPAFYSGNKVLINYAKFCELLDSIE